MIEPSWLTKHERKVIVAALDREIKARRKLARTAASAHTRAMAAADVHVASSLVLQITHP